MSSEDLIGLCVAEVYDAQSETKACKRISKGRLEILSKMRKGASYNLDQLQKLMRRRVHDHDLKALENAGLIWVSRAVGNRYEYQKKEWQPCEDLIFD